MQLTVVDHPLVADKLTMLRDRETDSIAFRRLVEELVTLLAYEATREIRTRPCTVQTPVAPHDGVCLVTPSPLVVPILRAGLGMLEGVSRLIPSAEVGFLGMVRNEETLQATTYANRLPEDLDGRDVYLLDPMLATGGTLVSAIDYVTERGAGKVTCITLVCAPEGLRLLADSFSGRTDLRVVTAGVDSRLDASGYIVPGLGDAGDRLYGIL